MDGAFLQRQLHLSFRPSSCQIESVVTSNLNSELNAFLKESIVSDGTSDALFCSVLAISDLGAKHDFEIWAFKVFLLWTRKTPLRMASRGSDLNIKIGNNTQEIHHKA